MSTIKNKIDQLINGKWEVRKCLFPYPEGYATYHTGTKTILDTALSKEEAQKVCDTLNTPQHG